MRVTVKTRVIMTVTLEQYKSEDKTIAEVKADLALAIQGHISKMLRPDKDDDIQVKVEDIDVGVLSATHEG